MSTLLQKRDRLSISFSGGKTSAFMANLLKNGRFQDWREVVVLFCNTGQEHEKTLEYVDKCDRAYGLNVVWLEAVVHPGKGVGTTHRVVTFETAARDGSPFEAVMQKYGLPNRVFQNCSREMKERVMASYRRSLGWEPNSFNVAVGIRADEFTRMSPHHMDKEGVFYPLVDSKVTKQQVLDWELQQPVRLGIPEHYGNCVWCWKKSLRKLATVAQETPRAFDFPARTEKLYLNHGAGDGNRRMFIGQRSTADIFALARDPSFEPFVDGFAYADTEMDSGMACGESCEVGVDGANNQEDEA